MTKIQTENRLLVTNGLLNLTELAEKHGDYVVRLYKRIPIRRANAVTIIIKL
jgi:hypothetical protein